MFDEKKETVCKAAEKSSKSINKDQRFFSYYCKYPQVTCLQLEYYRFIYLKYCNRRILASKVLQISPHNVQYS